MKYFQKTIFLIVTLLLLSSCSKPDDDIIAEQATPTEDLGLSINNEYPYWPYTFRAMGDNQWYQVRATSDTLKIFRRDGVTTDSGNSISYTFLIKSKHVIKPLRVKCVSYSAMLYVDEHENMYGIGPILQFDKPIENFKLQYFEDKKLLACQITTVGGDGPWMPPLVDRMWVDLSK